MRNVRNRKGFTLVEIMIVVAIIGLLAAIAIPNFVRAREQAAAAVATANKRQVIGAVQLWAIDLGKVGSDKPGSVGVLSDYIKKWPSHGTAAYNIPYVSDDETFTFY